MALMVLAAGSGNAAACKTGAFKLVSKVCRLAASMDFDQLVDAFYWLDPITVAEQLHIILPSLLKASFVLCSTQLLSLTDCKR
jgi:hypothetical protein